MAEENSSEEKREPKVEMVSRKRSAAVKKAWRKRRKLYGPSGVKGGWRVIQCPKGHQFRPRYGLTGLTYLRCVYCGRSYRVGRYSWVYAN